VDKIEDVETHFVANVTPIGAEIALTGEAQRDRMSEIEALRRAVMQQFDQYVKLNKKIPAEILTSIASIDDPGRLADTIAAHLPLKLESKQAVHKGERPPLVTNRISDSLLHEKPESFGNFSKNK
jgi:ATP-dependent Lon protease